MSNIKLLSEDEFNQEVVGANQLVMVDFYADWCMPCKMLTPILEELSNEYPQNLKVTKLNVDNARSTAVHYGISSIPCVVFFKDGAEVNRIVGLRAKEDLQSMINDLL